MLPNRIFCVQATTAIFAIFQVYKTYFKQNISNRKMLKSNPFFFIYFATYRLRDFSDFLYNIVMWKIVKKQRHALAIPCARFG